MAEWASRPCRRTATSPLASSAVQNNAEVTIPVVPGAATIRAGTLASKGVVAVALRRAQLAGDGEAETLLPESQANSPRRVAALRYDDTKLASLKDAKFDAAYSAAGKLKAIPEAMWLWVEALRLRGANS